MATTPLCSGFKVQPFRQKRVFPYLHMLSKDNPKEIWDDDVAYVLSRHGLQPEENPRSVYRVDKLYASLSKFAPGRVPSPTKSQYLTDGIRLARKCFSAQSHEKLTPMPLDAATVVELTTNKQASAGLTAWGCTKEMSMTRGLERAIQTVAGVKKPEFCIAGKRTQQNEKTRLVWMFPYSMTILEGLFARPLVDHFVDLAVTPMAFGRSNTVLGSQLLSSSMRNDWAYSIDMSSFDASVSAYLIHQAFDILSTWFDLDQIEPTTGVRYREIWDIVENYFIHTPIVMPDRNVYFGKRHGVPSGSYFTQMVDSIANCVIAGTISSRFRMNVDRSDLFILGDDLLMWSDRKVSLQQLAKFASETFHVEFNPTKSQVFHWDESVHFLGGVWDRGWRDVPAAEVIGRMVSPERYRHYSRDPETRRHEVFMLIASYLSTSVSAYLWVPRLLWSGPQVRMPLAGVDLAVKSIDRSNADKVNGLARYNLLYGPNRGSVYSTTMAVFG